MLLQVKGFSKSKKDTRMYVACEVTPEKNLVDRELSVSATLTHPSAFIRNVSLLNSLILTLYEVTMYRYIIVGYGCTLTLGIKKGSAEKLNKNSSRN